MSVYNSTTDDVNDEEFTMLAETFAKGRGDRDDRPRLPHPRQTSRDAFQIVDPPLPDWIREIEQILTFYRQELQPESNSQAHVHHQFILRLIDLVRPHYHRDKNKLKDFDQLFQDIIELYERETVKQKESVEELRRETAYWQRCSIIPSHEPSARPNVTLINEDLIELNQSIEHLNRILEAQQDRIKELTELISIRPGSEIPEPPVRTAEPKPSAAEKGTFEPSRGNPRRSERLIAKTRARRCMICETTFSQQADEDEIVQHLLVCTDEKFRKTSDPYICPICDQRVDRNDEQAYLQHLRVCFDNHEEF